MNGASAAIDTDGDGVEDCDEVSGCMNTTACNYDPDATDDDGSCDVAVEGCEECVDGASTAIDTDGDGVADCDEVLGCMDTTACNYDIAATDADSCEYAEEGFDCDGNCVVGEDCNGVCGGSAVIDECGVCGGSGIAEGDCDCDGNTLDALNICGGTCEADEDGDGICDDEDDCVGAYDDCGICNGPGSIYECGCADIPEGDCDCDGNVLDECEVCGGDGTSCLGCVYIYACNYDPTATIDDGSCEFNTCAGCTDPWRATTIRP